MAKETWMLVILMCAISASATQYVIAQDDDSTLNTHEARNGYLVANNSASQMWMQSFILNASNSGNATIDAIRLALNPDVLSGDCQINITGVYGYNQTVTEPNGTEYGHILINATNLSGAPQQNTFNFSGGTNITPNVRLNESHAFLVMCSDTFSTNKWETYYGAENYTDGKPREKSANNVWGSGVSGDYYFRIFYTPIEASIENISINLTDLSNGLSNFSVYYNFSGNDVSECNMLTPSANFTTTNGSGNCSFSNVNVTQSSTLTLTPGLNVSGVVQTGTASNAVRVALNQYFFNSSVFSTFSLQNFLREFNITSNLTRTFANILFSEDAIHPEITVTIPGNNTITALNKTNSTDFFSEYVWQVSTDHVVMNTSYTLNQTIFYNNTAAYALPAINITVGRDYCSDTPLSFFNTTSSVNYTYNSTNIEFAFASVPASATAQYAFNCTQAPVVVIGRDEATRTDLGAFLNYTFTETYQSAFNLTTSVDTTFSVTSFLPSYADRFSQNLTLVDGSGNAKDFNYSYDPVGLTFTVNFTSPDILNYTFNLTYSVADTSNGTQGSGGSGATGGGGGATRTEVFLSNATLDAKPRIVDSTALRYLITPSMIQVIANKQLESCTVDLGEEFTQCAIEGENIAVITTSPQNSDFFIKLFESQVTIKDKFSETISIPVRVNFVNLGVAIPIGSGSGINVPFITQNDLSGKLTGIRILPFLITIATGLTAWWFRK